MLSIWALSKITKPNLQKSKFSIVNFSVMKTSLWKIFFRNIQILCKLIVDRPEMYNFTPEHGVSENNFFIFLTFSPSPDQNLMLTEKQRKTKSLIFCVILFIYISTTFMEKIRSLRLHKLQ